MDSHRVILTGANRGLGYEILKLLIEKNFEYQVAATVRSNPDQFQEQLNSLYPGNHVNVYSLDLSQQESIQAFALKLEQTGQKFDALINNAALGFQQDFTGKTIPPSDKAHKTLKTNVIGTILLTQKILPLLNDNGRVINVSSKLGALSFQSQSVIAKFDSQKISQAEINQQIDNFVKGCQKGDLGGYFPSAYGTSKMMLNAWSRFILSKKMSEKQTAIAMSPGHCKTDMGGPSAPRSAQEGALIIYRHLWGEYSPKYFYHSGDQYSYYDCGP